jgi:hypothetical protein
LQSVKMVPSGVVLDDTRRWEEEILQKKFSVDIMACLNRAWRLVLNEPFPFMGATFLSIVCMLMLYLVALKVPCVGIIIFMLLSGVLFSGFCWYFLKKIRGEPAEIGDIFQGFQRNLKQTMIASAVVVLLTSFAFSLICLPFAFSFVEEISQPTFDPFHADLTSMVTLPVILSLMAATMALFFFLMIWLFAFPLLIDRKLPFWRALELSRKIVFRKFIHFFVLNFIFHLIVGIGLSLCCIGVIFTGPFGVATFLYAYEDVFGVQKSAAV